MTMMTMATTTKRCAAVATTVIGAAGDDDDDDLQHALRESIDEHPVRSTDNAPVGHSRRGGWIWKKLSTSKIPTLGICSLTPSFL